MISQFYGKGSVHKINIDKRDGRKYFQVVNNRTRLKSWKTRVAIFVNLPIKKNNRHHEIVMSWSCLFFNVNFIHRIEGRFWKKAVILFGRFGDFLWTNVNKWSFWKCEKMMKDFFWTVKNFDDRHEARGFLWSYSSSATCFPKTRTRSRPFLWTASGPLAVDTTTG